MTAEERAQLEKIAADTEDPLLAIALQLVLRGAELPAPVVQRLLNACSALLDGYDAMKRKFSANTKQIRKP